MRDNPPPPNRERYLKQAAQAESLARRAQSPEERQAFDDIARLWRQLAERRAD
jgi:hypothetical protein